MRIASVALGVAVCALAAGMPLGQIACVSADPPAANCEVKGPEKKGGLETWVITSDYQEKPAPLYVLLPDKFDRTRQ